MRINKKSQVTTFVIIGIVILVVVGLTFFVISILNKASSNPNDPELESIPDEFKTVRTYVESCVKDIGEEGIRKLSLHGGYIDPTNNIYTNQRLQYKSNKPFESDVVDLGFVDSSLTVPYWYYLDMNNRISSYTPTIESMEEQLSFYIEDNLISCLDDFSGLEVMGFDVTPITQPSVNVVITNQDEQFFLNYSLKVEKDETTHQINDYYTKSSLPLKKLYDIAYNLTYFESVTNHFDYFTKDLISFHSGYDVELLPPFFYSNKRRYNIFWSKTLVESKLKDLLYSYTQLFQVTHTYNFDDSFLDKIPEDNPLEKRFYLYTLIPLFSSDNSDKLKDVSINVNYFKQPIHLEVFPHSGEKIMPKHYPEDPKDINKLLEKDDLYVYEFFYDISYPLIVEIKNHDSDNKENNLIFNFAFEVNLIKNQNLNEHILGYGPVVWDHDWIDVKITDTDTTEAPPQSSIVLGETTNQNIFCKDSQRNSGNISLMVFDERSGEALEGVYISFGCGTYPECYIGKTELKYNSGYFSNKMPICINGYVLVEKNGYQSKRIKLTTEPGVSYDLGIIKLYKEIQKNISMDKLELKYKYRDNIIRGVEANNTYTNFTSNDSAIIMLKRINYDIDPDYEVYVQLESNNTQQINLVPGRYNLEILYMNTPGVIIPANCDKNCYWEGIPYLSGRKCTYYPSTSINFTPLALWGGVEFNESNPIIIRESDLYSNNSIRFHTIVYPKPNEIACLDSLEEMGKKKEYTLEYRTKLIPEFINNQ